VSVGEERLRRAALLVYGPRRWGYSGLTFAVLSGGVYHTCGVTRTGAAYCWGQNVSGQLGDGTTTDRLVPAPVAGNLTFTAMSAGGAHTCGATTSHAAYCWGRNDFGQLGDGTTTQRLVPTPIAGDLTFAGLSASGRFSSCGVTMSSAAYCWGRNDFGQVGDGTTTDRHVPTAVGSPSLLSQNACSLEPTLRSIEGTVSTSIRFVNQTAGPVTAYWLDYEGQRVFYNTLPAGQNTLPAGQSYDQQTYLTHPWVVTDATGACLGIWFPTESPGVALIGE
jgi:hypothetical protein